MTDQPTPCRIYAACLATYNNGRLHGEWIAVDGKGGDDIRDEIAAMLCASPYPNVMVEHPDTGEEVPSAEEWAVHDHEGFAGLITSEWPDLDEVAQLAEILADDDTDARRGLLWLVNDQGYSIADAIEQCGDVRTYKSDAHDMLGDYAQERFEETSEDRDVLSSWPFNCIDWKDAGKELEMAGDIAETTQDGERFIVTNASDF